MAELPTGYSALQIGTSALAILAAGYVAFIAGGLQVRDNINFTPNGTTTGAVIQVNGLTRIQQFPVTCTATGGLSTYSTCAARLPFTTTGGLLGVSMECGNWKVAMSGDLSFKKTLTSASGSVITNGNNLSLGTGAFLPTQLAVPIAWNPADILTFSTLVTPTGTLNTTRYDCQMWSTIIDKYGS